MEAVNFRGPIIYNIMFPYFLHACDSVPLGWYCMAKIQVAFQYETKQKIKLITHCLEEWSTLGPRCPCTFLVRAHYCKMYSSDTEQFP